MSFPLSASSRCGCGGSDDCALKRAGYYQPDTPTVEINRKIKLDREDAIECQKLWQKAKKSSGFSEPPPLSFDGCAAQEEPECPVSVCDDLESDRWCQRVTQLSQRFCSTPTEPIVKQLLQTNVAPTPPVNSPPKLQNCADVPQIQEICPAQNNKEIIIINKNEQKLNRRNEDTDPTSCDLASLGVTISNDQAPKVPAATECKKFMNFAQGIQEQNKNKMELYNPQNREKARDNIKSCMYLGTACFDKFDDVPKKDKCKADCCVQEIVEAIDRVDTMPEGCCDYRKSDKTDKFELPGDDFECPPMPDSEVDLLIKPPWFECPPEVSIAPYPAPVGAKIKPISKGIRTNFERNPTCLICGAKRKNPLKNKQCTKDLNLNSKCPAMKPRCTTMPEKRDQSYLKKVQNMLGVRWF